MEAGRTNVLISLCSGSDDCFATFTAIPRPQHLHATRIHVVTTDIYLHISGYFSARGILCECAFLVLFTTDFIEREWK